MVQNVFQISGTGPTLFGRNGEGDPYYTDGEIDIATLAMVLSSHTHCCHHLHFH
jgi:hypothetical protein